MSKGIVPKVPGNLVLNELTNMWLEPSSIGEESAISSVFKLEQQRSPNSHGKSTSIEPWEYLNIRPQSIMIDNQIPGANANLQMMIERDDRCCRTCFGSKYQILKGTIPVNNKFTQDFGTDDLMNNIYNNCIVGFNLKCRKTKQEYDWRMVYAKFNFKEEIHRGTSEPCDNCFKLNTVMLGSMGLIASLPQFYLAYLDSLPMKKKWQDGYNRQKNGIR